MKKVLRVFFIFAMLMVLVACTNDAGFPKVNDKDKVELTYSEVLDEFGGVEIDNQVLKLTLGAEIETDDVEVKLEGTAHIGDGAAMLNLKIAGDMQEGNINGDATLYLNDAGTFFNGKVNVKSSAEDISIEGKYKLDDVFSDFFGGEINFDELLELDISVLLQNESFERLVEEYEGLTFYKKGDKFQLRFIVNTELLIANQELLDELLEMGQPTDGQEIDMEFVVTVENKMLTELGLRMNVNDPIENMKIKIQLTASVVSEMPKFPTDFDEYEPFDMMNTFY